MPVPIVSSPSSPRMLMRDKIRHEIRRAILDGTFTPGERLSDDELAEWLGCSRTPIREALNDLEHAGLVEVMPNRYTRVATPRAEEAFEVVQTLGVIFGGAVRLATPLLADDVRARILGSIDSCLVDLERRDVPALNVHALATFDLFVEQCGNSHLIKLSHDTSAGLAFKLRLPNLVRIFNWPDLTQSFRDLRSAVEAGDAIAAELAAERLHQLPVETPGHEPVSSERPLSRRSA